MNLARLATLALRILAVYFCVSALVGLGHWLGFLASRADIESSIDWLWMVMAGNGVMGASGLVLFIWAEPLGRILGAGSGEPTTRGHAEIGGVALRMLGVLLWMWALSSLTRSIFQFLEPYPLAGMVELANGVIMIAVGTWFFFAGHSIAHWLLKTPPAESRRNYSQVQAIATSIAGVVLVVMGLPGVLEFAWHQIRRRTASLDGEMFGLTPAEPSVPWVYLGYVVLGVLLFFGSRGLSATWHRLRSAGLHTDGVGQPQDGRS